MLGSGLVSSENTGKSRRKCCKIRDPTSDVCGVVGKRILWWKEKEKEAEDSEKAMEFQKKLQDEEKE